MSNVELITVKDRINHICQINHFISPVFYHFMHFGQRIPVVNIGRVTFYGCNWMVDDRSKMIKLCNYIILQLDSKEFVTVKLNDLKNAYIEFGTVNTTDETLPSVVVK